jgi:DNA-binding MarR family transcriptional regulator
MPPNTQRKPGRAQRPPAAQRVSGLESHLGYWLRFVSNHVSHSFRKKVEARGVTVSEWVVLRELYRLGRTTPGALVQEIGMTKGAISKLLDRLEGKRLIARAVLEHDRRHQEIELLPSGLALVPQLAKLADRNDEEFFGDLPREVREELIRVMQQIVRTHGLKTVPVD